MTTSDQEKPEHRSRSWLDEAKTEVALRERVPFVTYQYVDVTFGSSQEDFIVTHTLTPIDPEAIHYEIVARNCQCTVWHDLSSTRRPWGAGYIVLRTDVGNATVRLRLSTAPNSLEEDVLTPTPGTAAPSTSAEYLVGAATPDLDAERVVTDTATVAWDLGTPAQAKANVPDDAITFAKFQNLTSDRLVGRDTASSGNAEEITVGGGLEFTGSTGIQRSALTGDVTASAGSNATTIPNDTVTFAKMQNIDTDRVLGREASGSGDIEQLVIGEALHAESTTLKARVSPGMWSPVDTRRGWAYHSPFGAVNADVPVGVGVKNAGLTAGNVTFDDDITTIASDYHAASAASGQGFGFRSNYGSGGVIRRGLDFDLLVNIETIPDITNIRLWVGFASGDTTVNADDWSGLAGADVLAFRFSTVAGDSGWKVVSQEGGVGTSTSAQVGSNLASGTAQRFRIRMVNSGTPTAYCSVNGSAEVQVTSNLPEDNRPLNLFVYGVTQSAAVKRFSHSWSGCMFPSGL